MNKPIIIDGVDVSGCEFLRYCVIPDNEGCKIDDSLCCDVNNCYYKQLQRLKTENEQLKQYKQSKQASYETMQMEWNKAINESRDVKAENKKYKQALGEIRKLIKLTVEFQNFACKKNCEDYKEPKEYHLLCRLMRISEKIEGVLKNENK